MRKTLKRQKFKSNKGITLIALVITIIVLLILAGVAISMLSGENGILRQAANAKTETEKQSTLEQIKLGAIAAMTNTEHKIKSKDDLLTALQQQGLNVTADNIEESNGTYKVTVNGATQIITSSGDVITASEVEQNQGKVLNENGNTPVKDEYGNTIMVPAGFAITKDASRVEDGIVVTDNVDENGNSTGNEFVWIPVNEVKTSKGTKTVTLGRYTWSGNTGISVQTVTTEAEATSAAAATVAANSSYYEVTPDNATYPQRTYKNARATNLVGFLKSAVKNGGYYIGRYEAGDATATEKKTARSSETEGTLVCKANQQVYNYIKQTDASNKCKNMYPTNSNYTSDLINSYAWDTAIIFIQQMSGKNDYANQNSLNQGSPITTGTSRDVQYNIYDMASNVFEWSTETYSRSNNPCVLRGGSYHNSDFFTSTRNSLPSMPSIPRIPPTFICVGLDSDSDAIE